MKKYFNRINLMLNREIEFFDNYNIMVIGLGGVGSHSCESLIRSGIKNLIIVDYDSVDTTNVNRQLMAKKETIGTYKTIALKKHLLSINEDANITDLNVKITSESLDILKKYKVDFVIDAIDSVTDKLNLIKYCQDNDIYIISALGTGNKIDPTQIRSTTLYKTSKCPLARVIRREAKKRDIRDFPVVYSEEPSFKHTKKEHSRNVPGSMIFVPGAVGYALSSQIIQEILKKNA